MGGGRAGLAQAFAGGRASPRARCSCRRGAGRGISLRLSLPGPPPPRPRRGPAPPRRPASYEFSRPDGGGGADPWSLDAVLADRFLSVAARLQPALRWEEEAGEHFAKFKVGWGGRAGGWGWRLGVGVEVWAAGVRALVDDTQEAGREGRGRAVGRAARATPWLGPARRHRAGRRLEAKHWEGSDLVTVRPRARGQSGCGAKPPPLQTAQEGGKRRRLYFPTPASLAARVALAREWGVGLSIWELGQGMEAFFDLL